MDARMRGIGWGLLVAIVVGMFVGGAPLGCINENKSDLKEQADQRTSVPTKTQQDSAQQGSQYYLYIQTQPNAGGGQSPTSQPGSMLEQILATNTQAGANAVRSGGQTNIAVVSIGSSAMTPTQTGSTTGTGSATQTPTATQTASPTQRNQHELTASTPIAVNAAPAGQIDQQASATGRGTTTGQTKTSEQDLRYEQLNAKVDKLTRLLDLLHGAPTSQPEKQTAE